MSKKSVELKIVVEINGEVEDQNVFIIKPQYTLIAGIVRVHRREGERGLNVVPYYYFLNMVTLDQGYSNFFCPLWLLCAFTMS